MVTNTKPLFCFLTTELWETGVGQQGRAGWVQPKDRRVKGSRFRSEKFLVKKKLCNFFLSHLIYKM